MRLVTRTSKDDGSTTREAFAFAIDKLSGSYHMSREEIEDTLRRGTPMQTPFAYYQIEEERMALTTSLTGPECDGEACDEYEHRAGCSLYTDHERS